MVIAGWVLKKTLQMFVEALLREGYVWWRFQNPWRRGGVATHMGLVDAILLDMVCEFASNHIFHERSTSKIRVFWLQKWGHIRYPFLGPSF